MTKDVIKKENDVISYDENGNAILSFDKNVHFVVNGDFEITANGEVSILSKTAMSLDCALILLNCRLSKQIRRVKEELRMEFVDMIGGMPNLTEEQKQYARETKKQAMKLLDLTETEVSHLNFEEGDKE
jgi:hypothetical protein